VGYVSSAICRTEIGKDIVDIGIINGSGCEGIRHGGG